MRGERAIGVWRAVLAGAVVLGCAGVTHALTLVPADLNEMVVGSQTIVRGRVARVDAVVAGPRREIERIVTLTVLDEIKGDVPATVVFRVPGGQVGRYRRVVVGAPEFEEGDDVVVFLRGRAPIVPMPFGLSQGVYRVSAGGREVAPFAPMIGVAARGDGRRLPTVDEFRRTVRALSEQGR